MARSKDRALQDYRTALPEAVPGGLWTTTGLGLARSEDVPYRTTGRLPETVPRGLWTTTGLGLARSKDRALQDYRTALPEAVDGKRR